MLHQLVVAGVGVAVCPPHL